MNTEGWHTDVSIAFTEAWEEGAWALVSSESPGEGRSRGWEGVRSTVSVAAMETALCVHNYSSASLRVARRWKQCERPSMDEWISRVIGPSMKLFSLIVLLILFSLQKGEILTHVPIGVNEDVMIN